MHKKFWYKFTLHDISVPIKENSIHLISFLLRSYFIVHTRLRFSAVNSVVQSVFYKATIHYVCNKYNGEQKILECYNGIHVSNRFSNIISVHTIYSSSSAIAKTFIRFME
jgi:hypothetical protein